MSHGVAQAGFDIVEAVDVDEDSLTSLKMNHPGTLVERRPVEFLGTYGGPARFDWIGRWPDVVIGGPPCQGYSDAGRRDRKDPRAYRYHDFARVLRKYRPHAFILENVDSTVTIHGGEIFADMRRVLAEPGYFLECKVLRADHHGVAQERKRLFIVGSRHRGFQFPDRLPVDQCRTVRDAIGDLPPASRDGVVTLANGEIVTLHKAPKHKPHVIGRIRNLPEGGCAAQMEGGEHGGFHNSYKRLWWDRPALAITGQSGKPSSSPCIHPSEPRAWTLREAARLQSFPDDFRFAGTDTSIRQQIGNAVPPLLAQAVATALRQHLEANGVEILRSRPSAA